MLKCSIGVCRRKVVGGVREFIHDPLLANPLNTYLDEPMFYCEKHKEKIEELLGGKDIQVLVKEQLDYWAAK